MTTTQRETETPYQVAQRHWSMIVDQLPETGATIVVVTRESGKDLREAIVRKRSEAFAKACRFIPVGDRGDLNRLLGLSGVVVMDPMYPFSYVPLAVQGAIIEAIHIANAVSNVGLVRRAAATPAAA